MKRSELQPGMKVAVKRSTAVVPGEVVDPAVIEVDYEEEGRSYHGVPYEVLDHPNRYCTVSMQEWVGTEQIWVPRHVLLNHVRSTWERYLGFEALRKAGEALRREQEVEARRERNLRRRLLVSMAADAGLEASIDEKGCVRIEESTIQPWQEEGRVGERILFKVLKRLVEVHEDLDRVRIERDHAEAGMVVGGIDFPHT